VVNRLQYRPGQSIILAPHDASWAADFETEAAAVRTALGEVLLALHHIGSTAIPGIAAKPVIDMLAVVSGVGVLDRRADTLVALGYEAMGEFGIPGRRYFRKSSPEGVRTHQIHAFATGSPEVDRHLRFRDYLRAHPLEAQQYSALKQELAQRFGHDIEGYAAAKTDFIRRIEALAASM
jgi:GrpB-like predicted nucleotidyltransferase (UPF0157 family)